MTATFHVGDAIEVMSKLPEKSVDLILTSPPFLALRSYLPADHPDKALEGGSQATPGEFIDWLLDVAEACNRVLAPHGSLCIELGDTYSGSSAVGGDELRGHANGFRGGKRGESPESLASISRNETGWPLAKSLSLIPESFRFAMVYGRNPFTGRQTDPWRLRNVIRWVRPNPPVGALGDKFRPATSELMVFCKSAKRYFDLDAVREALKFPEATPKVGKNSVAREGQGGDWSNGPDKVIIQNPAGAPPLDWWNIPPGGYEGAHYAVWPPELCIKPVKAMCPERVCKTCGEPSRRIVEAEQFYRSTGEPTEGKRAFTTGAALNAGLELKQKGVLQALGHDSSVERRIVSEHWSDCGHDDWRPGLVLDPFAGSGTTLAVATGHGRDAIGIDLDERNYELALQRVGPFILERAS